MKDHSKSSQAYPSPIQVLFDGSCSYCAREIAYYKRATRSGAVEWTDISLGDNDPVAGITRGKALSRFHVIDQLGVIFTGGRAFALIWRQVPHLRLLAHIFSVPPFSWVLAASYEDFLLCHRIARRRTTNEPQHITDAVSHSTDPSLR